ncbi:MAG: HEAT repeat domain-containing protein [Planctomycetaceae bacterium]|nr:HEAT repeat domain-containing protein [Planctomycetaceae bacterium]
MRRLPEKVEEIAWRLRRLRQPRLFRRFQEAEVIGLVASLGNTGEAGALTSLVDCLSVRNTKVRAAARAAIVQVMSGLTNCQLLELQDWIRWRWHWSSPDGWHQTMPADVVKLAGAGKDTGYVEILGLLSFHSNGYVRHEAVRKLAKVQDGTEIPFLLLRQNDWVWQIRDEAAAAVTSRITDAGLPHLLQSMELVLHLSRFTRQDHQEVVGRILKLLLQDRHDELLQQAVSHAERTVRRAVVRYGLAVPGEHGPRLIRVGMKSEDGVIRLLYARHLPELYEGDSLLTQLRQLATDRFQPVRLAALRLIAKHFPDLADATWRGALCDAGRAVRELARFMLRPAGDCDIASMYRRQADEAGRNLPALEGLAECGDSTDAPFFRRLLEHPLPSRRAAAVRGLSRVSSETVIGDLVPLLTDCSPRVLRAVRQALHPVCRMISESLLEEIAIKGTSRAVRRNAALLLADRGRWACLPALLRVTVAADAETATFAEHCIAGWFTRKKCRTVFIRPTALEREQITAARGQVSTGLLNLILQTMDCLS